MFDEQLAETERNLRDAILAYAEYRETDERLLASPDPSDLERLVDIGISRIDDLIASHNGGIGSRAIGVSNARTRALREYRGEV